MHPLTLPIIALVLSILAFTLAISNARAQHLARVADCVVLEAQAQGYAGNPHGPEAWDLFALNCK